MASIEQYETAIRNAQAAGDTAAVERLTKKLAAKQADPSWGDVGSAAIRNVPQSAGQLVSDTISAVTDPVGTLDTLFDLTAGGISRGIEAVAGDQSWLPENEATQTADAVGRFYADRYGSMGGFKKALANDPVGVVTDIAGLFSGGTAAAAKAPGVLGKAAKIAQANRPAALAAKGGKQVVKLASGLGDDVIDTLSAAGEAGGSKQATALQHMRGKGSGEELVSKGKTGVKALKEAASDEYEKANTALLKGNKTPLDYADVKKSVDDVIESMTYEGQWKGGEKSKAIANKVINDLYDFNNPASRNPEGANALRQKIATLKVTPGAGTSGDVLQGNRIINAALESLGKKIESTVPGYKEMNEGWSKHKDELKQMQTTLSLNDKASVDTTLRKLLSAARDNVQTNFGDRTKLVKRLDDAGAGGLMEGIAGEAAKGWLPSGMARPALAVGAMQTFGPGLAAIMANPLLLAKVLPYALASSPRVVGETAVKVGQAKRKLNTPTGKKVKAAASGANQFRKKGTTLERTTDEEAYIVDAKGNEYDRNGRLIGKRK